MHHDYKKQENSLKNKIISALKDKSDFDVHVTAGTSVNKALNYTSSYIIACVTVYSREENSGWDDRATVELGYSQLGQLTADSWAKMEKRFLEKMAKHNL